MIWGKEMVNEMMMTVFFFRGLGPCYETIIDAILGSDRMANAAVLAKLQESWFSRQELSHQEGNTPEHVTRASDIAFFKCGERGHKKSESPKLRGKRGAGKKPPKKQRKKVRFARKEEIPTKHVLPTKIPTRVTQLLAGYARLILAGEGNAENMPPVIRSVDKSRT